MEKSIIVRSASVLDPRELAQLVSIANKFSGKILFSMGERTVNAKSIMGMMGFGMDVGSKVTVFAEGEDSQAAVEALETFLG